MAKAPTYVSQGAAPNAPGMLVAPQDLPRTGQGAAMLGEAVSQLGQAGVNFAVTFENAQQDTQIAQAKTRALTKMDELERRYVEDNNFRTARTQFATEAETLKGEVYAGLEGVAPQKLAEFDNWFARVRLPSAGNVHKAALQREQQVNRAGLIERSTAYESRAVNAGSPVERAAVMKEWETDIDRMAGSQWISPVEAANFKLQAGRSLQKADVTRLMREDPQQAYVRLGDAESFPLLDAEERERLRTAAGSAADQLKIDRLAVRAANDPQGAQAALAETEFSAPHAQYRARAAIASAAAAEATRTDHAARVAASVNRSDDPVLDLVKSRYPVDDGRIEAALRKNDAAAAAGDIKAAEYARDLREQMALKPIVDRLYSQTPAQNEAELAGLEAKVRAGENVTASEFRAIKALKAVNAEIAEKKLTEPVALFERAYPQAGAVQIDPRADAAAPSFSAALALRGQQALAAQGLWGGSFAPFKAAEAEMFKQRIAQAGSNERADILAGFARNLPPRVYEAAIEQTFGKDAVTAFAGRVMTERPNLAREILDGQALIKAEGTTKAGAATLREALASRVGGNLYPSATMQDHVVRAAEALAVARAGSAGALYQEPDRSAIEQAIEAVTGPIVTRGGVKVPLPPMLGRARALAIIDNLSDTDIALSGGAIDVRGEEMPAATIARHAQLRPLQVGGARYAVTMPSADGKGAPVLDRDGRPLVLDLAYLDAQRRGGEQGGAQNPVIGAATP